MQSQNQKINTERDGRHSPGSFRKLCYGQLELVMESKMPNNPKRVNADRQFPLTVKLTTMSHQLDPELTRMPRRARPRAIPPNASIVASATWIISVNELQDPDWTNTIGRFGYYAVRFRMGTTTGGPVVLASTIEFTQNGVPIRADNFNSLAPRTSLSIYQPYRIYS